MRGCIQSGQTGERQPPMQAEGVKAGHCLAPLRVVASKLPCLLCIAFALPCFTAVTSGKDDKKEGVDYITYRYPVCPLSGGAAFTGSFLLFNSLSAFLPTPHPHLLTLSFLLPGSLTLRNHLLYIFYFKLSHNDGVFLWSAV